MLPTQNFLRRIARARRDDRGAAVVEFALVVPVLFLIVFAVIDFGRALWTLNVLTSGVREGARAGSTEATTALAIDSAKARTARYINGILGTSLTAANITATYDGTTGSATFGQIRVYITNGFTFSPVTPFASNMGLGNLKFQPNAYYRWERAN
ncbi:TadE/TadG family type IV pilus assembly protein [Roseisolibacter sp. H3M3-2]|uniref:TadE/TadG family type IV pilus assembly protein n=1 Tax=Roseisolibacter sp. H3M3-2 TaxID=3031323 RepID=UPI0023D97A57|nr:TadE/TadG family type IV pilus assembly protein [Roseisolibacter sp. H3M3-2]MDF1501874.1 TadE/TadG family type IV pilus assembly protein [Roseisolibacter sp. H3M3-2]